MFGQEMAPWSIGVVTDAAVQWLGWPQAGFPKWMSGMNHAGKMRKEEKSMLKAAGKSDPSRITPSLEKCAAALG